MAAASGWYHLYQARQLGAEQQRCRITMAEFERDAQIDLARAVAEARRQEQEEQIRLRAQRDRQRQENIALREMFDRTVDALGSRLEEQALQEPEIVPWLDTPVPSSLLRD